MKNPAAWSLTTAEGGTVVNGATDRAGDVAAIGPDRIETQPHLAHGLGSGNGLFVTPISGSRPPRNRPSFSGLDHLNLPGLQCMYRAARPSMCVLGQQFPGAAAGNDPGICPHLEHRERAFRRSMCRGAQAATGQLREYLAQRLTRRLRLRLRGFEHVVIQSDCGSHRPMQ